MPLTDIAVLLSIGISTPALARLLWRCGMRGRRLFTTVWVGFYGLVLAIMMVAHCIDVLSRLYIGQGYDGAAFVYNFRVYALLLLGAALIGCGLRLLKTALDLSHGGAAARSGGVRTTLLVLAVVAPLIPIHSFFAIPLTALGALTLLLLVWATVPQEPQGTAILVPEQQATREPISV